MVKLTSVCTHAEPSCLRTAKFEVAKYTYDTTCWILLLSPIIVDLVSNYQKAYDYSPVNDLCEMYCA